MRRGKWRASTGVILAVLLPLLGVLEVRRWVAVEAMPIRFVVPFLVAITLGHLGLAFRQGLWEPILWLRDLLIGLLMGMGAWAVVMVAVRSGGGPVDPTIVALMGSYLLLAWPAVTRS